MKLLCLISLLVASCVGFADVTDDIVKTSLGDPAAAAQIAVVPIRSKLLLENSLTEVNRFCASGPFDQYRTVNGRDTVVRFVGKSECLELRLGSSSEPTRFHYDTVSTAKIDAPTGLVRVFLDRIQNGEPPGDVIQGYRTKKIREWVDIDLVKLFATRKGLEKVGIRNSETYRQKRGVVTVSFVSANSNGPIPGNCFMAEFKTEMVDGRRKVTNIHLTASRRNAPGGLFFSLD